MALELKTRGNTRITPVSFFETNSNNEQEELFFNVEHLRITHEVGEKLVSIEQEVKAEQLAYWQNQNKPKAEQKELALPRNVTVEQLVYLVKSVDISLDGEPIKPTRENFKGLDTSITGAILSTITETVLPEKKKL